MLCSDHSYSNYSAGSEYDEETLMVEEGAAITVQAAYRGWAQRKDMDEQQQEQQRERQQPVPERRWGGRPGAQWQQQRPAAAAGGSREQRVAYRSGRE